MALGEMRRWARIHALTTAEEEMRSMGEEGSSADDHEMSDEEFELFIQECKRLAKQLGAKAHKLRLQVKETEE